MNSSYSNPDNDRCAWMSGSPVASDASTHQGMVYAIQHPFTGIMVYPSSRAHWRYAQDQMLEYMNGWCEYKLEDLYDDKERAKICGIDVSKIKPNVKAIVLANDLEISKKQAKAVYDKGPWPRFYFTNKGKGGIRRKVYLDSVGGRIATNYWPYEETGHTDEAKKELIRIFGDAPFDTPKPTRLLRRVFDLSTNKDSTILDFFAGSGTTLHATMQLNAEDGGNRRFILVQLPELCDEKSEAYKTGYKNICEIGKERIRRAGKMLKDALESSGLFVRAMKRHQDQHDSLEGFAYAEWEESPEVINAKKEMEPPCYRMTLR